MNKFNDKFIRYMGKDKSGKIDKKELKVGLKGLSQSLGIPEPTDKDVKYLFNINLGSRYFSCFRCQW